MTDKRTRVAVIRQRHSQTPAVAANISSRDFLSRDTSPILGREQWPRCCPGQYPRLFKNNSRDYIYFVHCYCASDGRGALLITLKGLFEGWICTALRRIRRRRFRPPSSHREITFIFSKAYFSLNGVETPASFCDSVCDRGTKCKRKGKEKNTNRREAQELQAEGWKDSK